MMTDVAFSGAVAKSGVAHSGQNAWATVAALCDLDVALGRASQDKRFDWRSHDRPKRRTGQNLAIRAMADHHARCIDFRGERDQPAMASSFDLHDEPSQKTGRVRGA